MLTDNWLSFSTLFLSSSLSITLSILFSSGNGNTTGFEVSSTCPRLICSLTSLIAWVVILALDFLSWSTLMFPSASSSSAVPKECKFKLEITLVKVLHEFFEIRIDITQLRLVLLHVHDSVVLSFGQ